MSASRVRTIELLLILSAMPAVAQPPNLDGQARRLGGKIVVAIQKFQDDARSGPYSIIRIDPHTGKWNKHAQVSSFYLPPFASPDGKQVIYAKRNKDAIELLSLALNGGMTPSVIHSEPFKVNRQILSQVAWSPDSAQLIIRAVKDRRRVHLLVNVDGSGSKQLKLPDGEVHDWSRDGQWLAMVCNRPSTLKIQENLFIVRPDGSEETRLTTKAIVRCPRFSPDGTKLTYYNRMDRRFWIVGVDGKNPKPLREVQKKSQLITTCWSPDGKYVVATGWPMDFVSKERVQLEFMSTTSKPSFRREIGGLIGYWVGAPRWYDDTKE